MTTDPDGILKGYSPILELYLCWDEGLLLFFDPVTATYLRNLRQERALREAEQERTQAELSAERDAREVEQARIRHLEEELRRLRQGG